MKKAVKKAPTSKVAAPKVAAPKVAAVIKPMAPRGPDAKYTGEEPVWLSQPVEYRTCALTKAFSWYNVYCDKKDAKSMIAHWLTHNDRAREAKYLLTVPDSVVSRTIGWLCRMNLMGLDLTVPEQETVEARIKRMLAIKQEIKEENATSPEAQKINIQDRLRDCAIECGGELEGLFDEFIANGAKMSADFKPIAIIRGMNVAPHLISTITDGWKSKIVEFENVVKGKDQQLVEGYSNFSKIQMRNLIKFCELVISDCGAYIQIKKVEKKPRKKKAVSPEKQAAKFKYLPGFPELKLTSISPTQLVNAAEAFLYDTKKRKLIHVVADVHLGTFTIKGSTIIGLDTAQSQQKTLRKPDVQIKALLAGGKPASRKYFKDIKATEVKWNGRSNSNLIILRAG